ncbi:MAG: hypothetical protein U0172_04865 [Nitrospiraceae bacterium]
MATLLTITRRMLTICAIVSAPLWVAEDARSSNTWQVVYSANDELCEPIAESVDEAALREGTLRFKGAGVASVAWKGATIAGEGPPPGPCAKFEQAEAAWQPGGMPMLVVRSRFCMKGTPSESLYFFAGRSDVLSRATWQDLSPLHATLEKFERTGGTYRLTHLPPDDGPVDLRERFLTDVVVVQGRASTALTAPPYAWIVIGKPHGQGTLQDQCYLRRIP